MMAAELGFGSPLQCLIMFGAVELRQTSGWSSNESTLFYGPTSSKMTWSL